MTGKGAHLIVVDDPFKAAEASSDAVRNSVYDWFEGSLMTRFDKPAEGAMVVVMQRLHQDDLIGRLRDEGGWEYLAMPGEFSERAEFDLGDGERWILDPGDLLYPERFDRAALDQLLSDLGEAQFNAQISIRWCSFCTCSITATAGPSTCPPCGSIGSSRFERPAQILAHRRNCAAPHAVGGVQVRSASAPHPIAPPSTKYPAIWTCGAARRGKYEPWRRSMIHAAVARAPPDYDR